MKTVPVHKKNPALGVKALTYLNHVFLEEEDAVAIKDNEEVTLMDWGNAIVRKINYDNGKVVSLEGELHLEVCLLRVIEVLCILSEIAG